MDISTLTDSVDEMCRTWTAFQEENDRTTGRNHEALHKMNGRMDQLETAIRRANRTPASPAETRDCGPEVKAYFDYLRHGFRPGHPGPAPAPAGTRTSPGSACAEPAPVRTRQNQL